MIVKNGLQRMYEKEEDVFYYLTLYNENISHPPMPEGVEEGIIKGLYLFRPAPRKLNITSNCSAAAPSCNPC